MKIEYERNAPYANFHFNPIFLYIVCINVEWNTTHYVYGGGGRKRKEIESHNNTYGSLVAIETEHVVVVHMKQKWGQLQILKITKGERT